MERTEIETLGLSWRAGEGVRVGVWGTGGVGGWSGGGDGWSGGQGRDEW